GLMLLRFIVQISKELDAETQRNTNKQRAGFAFLCVSAPLRQKKLRSLHNLQQMRNPLHHSPEYRGVGPYYNLIELSQTEALYYPLVFLGGADGAADQLDSDHAFHYIFS